MAVPAVPGAGLAKAWATLAAGEGAKGLRLYHWARIATSHEQKQERRSPI